MVTPGGLTRGEKIRSLVVSLVAKAHSKVRDVAESPQVSYDKRAATYWNVVTLPNDDGCFTMDGIIPIDAVVDTGAKKVMIGKEVADMMGLIEEDLEPREAYITAAETLEALCGVTKRPVEFLIGRGTKNCTSAYLKVVVSHSTRYSVLIGTELIAMVGGMVDTWHHKLHYRPDWDIGGHWVVGLPVRMTRELPKNYLACKFYGGLMGTSRGVQEGPDLVRDELVDGNVRLGGAAEGDTELSASVGVVAWVGGVEGNLNLP